MCFFPLENDKHRLRLFRKVAAVWGWGMRKRIDSKKHHKVRTDYLNADRKSAAGMERVLYGSGEPKMFSSDFSIRFQIALWEKGEQKGCGWDT